MHELVCKECRRPVEFYKSSEETQIDGRVQCFEEYLCRTCRAFIKICVESAS